MRIIANMQIVKIKPNVHFAVTKLTGAKELSEKNCKFLKNHGAIGEPKKEKQTPQQSSPPWYHRNNLFSPRSTNEIKNESASRMTFSNGRSGNF